MPWGALPPTAGRMLETAPLAGSMVKKSPPGDWLASNVPSGVKTMEPTIPVPEAAQPVEKLGRDLRHSNRGVAVVDPIVRERVLPDVESGCIGEQVYSEWPEIQVDVNELGLEQDGADKQLIFKEDGHRRLLGDHAYSLRAVLPFLQEILFDAHMPDSRVVGGCR